MHVVCLHRPKGGSSPNIHVGSWWGYRWSGLLWLAASCHAVFSTQHGIVVYNLCHLKGWLREAACTLTKLDPNLIHDSGSLETASLLGIVI